MGPIDAKMEIVLPKVQFKTFLQRISGVSTPVFGVSWRPPNHDRQELRRLIIFIEDRRILFRSDFVDGRSDWVVQSILEIRNELTKTIQNLSEDSKAIKDLRVLRKACRDYLSVKADIDEGEFIEMHYAWQDKMHVHVKNLVLMYGIELEEDFSIAISYAK